MVSLVKTLLVFTAVGLFATLNKGGVEIAGEIKDLHTDKLYFIGTDSKRPFFDSVSVENGKFSYTHKKIQESIIVKMYYKDSKGTKWFFHFESLRKGLYLGQFLLENSRISIGGNQNYQTVSGGNENRLFKLRHYDLDDVNRKIYDENGILKNYQFLSENNTSTYLLQNLEGSKIVMNEAEIRKQFNLFDNSIKTTQSGKDITDYLTQLTRINKEKINDSYVFYDLEGKAVRLNQQFQKDKLTLYVFWASWCIPCRNEIPELKKFYQENKDKINIVSLSIDKDLNQWKEAVKKEQMPWLNLGDSPSTIGTVERRFLINSIPDMIVIDNAGNKVITDRNIPISRLESYLKK